MPYPNLYDITYSYTGFQEAQGDDDFPGTQLDSDLAGLEASIENVSTFMKNVIRSDGKLNNGIVTYDSLSPKLQTAGIAPANAWVTDHDYVVDNSVIINSALYRALVPHTSGVFATDLAAGKWLFITALTGSSQPKVSRYVTGRGLLPITPGCTLIHVKPYGSGGGGAGINNTNWIPQSQYGGRGGDTAFGTHPPAIVTITTGATTTVNWPGHTMVADHPFWLETTGALPAELTPGTASTGTVYYVIGPSIVPGVSFRISTRPYIPFPGDVQPEIVTSAPQSGVHSVVAYRYIVQGGGGGGIIGDQGTPLAYIGFNSDGRSLGINGGSGHGIYGQNVSGAAGGGPYGGGSGQGGDAVNGNDLTGGGGAGAGANRTASGGTGGASGSSGEIWMVPDAASYAYMIGERGAAGLAGAQTVTMTIASPCVFTLPEHGYMGEEAFTLTTTGALPTGLALATTYYVLQDSPTTPIGANTFYASATFRGSPVITTGSQSGVHTLRSGSPGGLGGKGSITLEEFFGAM